MFYEGKCPHCGNIVRAGHGDPMKRIDTPVRTCPNCKRPYKDENMYEWAVLPSIYKFYFYILANNRGMVLGILFLLPIILRSFIGLIFPAAWMALCYAYVKLVHKKKIEASKIRCSDPDYIELLNVIKYDKLAEKYDNLFKFKYEK